MSARLCGCGCGVALTPRQRSYASRGCTQRALWANPTQQAKRVAALRKAKTREGVSHWWEEARQQRAWRLLERTEVLDGLDREALAALRVTLAILLRDTYQRGYRGGRDSITRRWRDRRAA
ncbi:hypothetical protein [Luteitalea sp.]|uniref:hypothetical protein n=1 Tax=Luteitalea sp. TaxID=2004800 RepID=UPI0025C2CFA3|nr:hypothetical protein [Luteitalea sp.]